MNDNFKESVLFSILDSKHINTTLRKSYNVKLVDCNDYVSVYFYENKKIKDKKIKDDELDLVLKDNFKDSKIKDSNINRVIEPRSVIRSKLECQRLAKANIKEWKTFITLTFENNITDVNEANKRFRYFRDKVQRVYKDFKYICITEFQKRGAVHYHLLTNIDINDTRLIETQEDNPKFKHIKYWIDGFTSVELMEGDPKKVVGYIAKYMTKDIDNRLFNKHRYFASKNLNKPKTLFLNIDDEIDLNFYIKKIQDTNLSYNNEYINPYDNTKVKYIEFSKK